MKRTDWRWAWLWRVGIAVLVLVIVFQGYERYRIHQLDKLRIAAGKEQLSTTMQQMQQRIQSCDDAYPDRCDIRTLKSDLRQMADLIRDVNGVIGKPRFDFWFDTERKRIASIHNQLVQFEQFLYTIPLSDTSSQTEWSCQGVGGTPTAREHEEDERAIFHAFARVFQPQPPEQWKKPRKMLPGTMQGNNYFDRLIAGWDIEHAYDRVCKWIEEPLTDA